MVQSISKLLGALLAVLLLYIVPAAQAAERQNDISGLNTYHSTVRFVDMVRTKGYITPTMYNDFIRELELTGNTYEVELEHMHKNMYRTMQMRRGRIVFSATIPPYMTVTIARKSCLYCFRTISSQSRLKRVGIP